MNWMYLEFSSEVLLSLIELTQFQMLLEDFGNRIPRKKLYRQLIFYEGIPCSSIVHEERIEVGKEEVDEDPERMRVKHIASALYAKYIIRHCELQINISCILRSQWGALNANDYPMEEVAVLSNVVDECILEMTKYVRQSYLRFDMKRK